MKKIAFVAAVAAVALSSCGGGEVKPDFKDEVDSLTYELNFDGSLLTYGRYQRFDELVYDDSNPPVFSFLND